MQVAGRDLNPAVLTLQPRPARVSFTAKGTRLQCGIEPGALWERDTLKASHFADGNRIQSRNRPGRHATVIK